MRCARPVLSGLMAIGLAAVASACGSKTPANAPAVEAARSGEGPRVSPTPDLGRQTTVTDTTKPPALSIPGTFRTQSVLSLSEATPTGRQRIEDAMWDFRGGKFTFDSTNVSANLFPLIGSYSLSGTKVAFHASNSFSAGAAGSTSAAVEGTLDLTSATVSFQVESNAFQAAVVDGQPMGGGNSSVIRGEVQVKAGPKIAPHYTGPNPGSYSVTVRGSVGGVSFSRSGTLLVAKSAGGNPVDVCLISGFPAGTPEVGAIRFVSNTVCFPGASNNFDMGAVTVSGSTITVKADPMMESTLMNQFTASNSLFACLFSVRSGTMKVTVTGGRASGSIEVNSGSCGGGQYQAQF